MIPTLPPAQHLVIQSWLPAPVLNGSRQKHWAVLAKEAKAAKVMAWASAKQAGWVFMPDKVRLTVIFVFPVKRKRDTDNLYARAKHLVDGLKKVFFEDDCIEHLDLRVSAVVEPGVKQTRLTLEPVQ